MHNISDAKIQQKMLHETSEPSAGPQTAISLEMRQQNQIKKKSTTQLIFNKVQSNSCFSPAIWPNQNYQAT